MLDPNPTPNPMLLSPSHHQLEADLRQQTHDARTAGAQLAESRAEVARLREEKGELAAQLQQVQSPGMADYEDSSAQQQLQGRLDTAERQREEVARKLGKALTESKKSRRYAAVPPAAASAAASWAAVARCDLRPARCRAAAA